MTTPGPPHRDAPADVAAHPHEGARGAHVTTEDRLRSRLGLPPRSYRMDPTARLWGWLGPLLVTALAAVLRLTGLNHPSRLVFDETYYVKGAYSLLTLGYEGDWPAEDANDRFITGDYSDLSTEADYVVHPPVGKWMISLGLRWLGADNGAGWRIAAALTGTLAVLLLARVAARLFRSPLLGTVAGLLLAVDGMHLTGSRTSLLDSFLMFWVLVGFWAVLRDRDSSRARLAQRAAVTVSAGGGLAGRWGPRLGVRWWLVVAGLAVGLATGVKWSGLYAAAVLGILVFCWDTAARRRIGARGWLAGGVLRGGAPAFVALVPTVALTYLASWWPWFRSPDSYMRQWAAEQRTAEGTVDRAMLPDALNSWWEYHLRMWDFHTTLDSEHSYASHPAGWLLQWRPTSFYWPEDPPQHCGAERCVEAITSVGNPLIWWLGAVALLLVLWMALRHRDWRAWTILAGYAAMYLPWFAYTERTIFTFYAVAFVPFVVLALTYALGWVTGILEPPGSGGGPAGGTETTVGALSDAEVLASRQIDGDTDAPASRRSDGDGDVSASRCARFVHVDGKADVAPLAWTMLVVLLALVLAVSAYFWPVWTGQNISYDFWWRHMWLPSWV